MTTDECNPFTAACEKSIACSTCHIILEEAVYDALEEPSDDENDMLDLAFGLTDTYAAPCTFLRYRRSSFA